MHTVNPLPDGHLLVDFAGEDFQVAPGETFSIGREGNLALDDNPYLHRDFLSLECSDGLWWVRNDGSRLAAGLTDEQGLMRSTLAPGARLPLVFARTLLTFSAGTTTYEVLLVCKIDGYRTSGSVRRSSTAGGETTIAPTALTESQLLAILALAEPVLRRVGTGASAIPTSVAAAKRLGWTNTRFHRKLDNVCDKLSNAGVNGLRGSERSAASNRRVQLVEYAVSTLLVTADHLPLLDDEARANAPKEAIS